MFSKYLADVSEQKFLVQVFGPGEVVPAFQVFDAVSAGTVEMGNTASYYYIGKDLAFAFGTAVPFGLNTRQMNAWLSYGGGLDLLNDLYKTYNVYGVPFGNTTAQMGGWFRKEIKTVDDLKGLKFRVGGVAGQVLSRLGVVPQQLPPADIYPALEKGAIDAAEWIGPYDDEKLGFVKIAPYYYYPGWWEGCANGFLYINSAKWAELPKAYQQMVSTVAGHWPPISLPSTTAATRRRSNAWLPRAHSCVRSRSIFWMPATRRARSCLPRLRRKTRSSRSFTTRRRLFATTNTHGIRSAKPRTMPT